VNPWALAAIDIPVGLPDTGSREADSVARKFIGPRASSVFPCPIRLALEATTGLLRPLFVGYHRAMQVATGTVVEGKIVVEGLSLPEGTVVTVLTRDIEPTVRLSPQEEAELLDALDEADREEGISAEELFERLRRHT